MLMTDSHSPSTPVHPLLALLRARAAFFADPGGDAYAELSGDAGGDVLRLGSKAFRAWIDRVSYETTGALPPAEVRRGVLSVLTGRRTLRSVAAH
jgi:hypothetical protein